MGGDFFGGGAFAGSGLGLATFDAAFFTGALAGAGFAFALAGLAGALFGFALAAGFAVFAADFFAAAGFALAGFTFAAGLALAFALVAAVLALAAFAVTLAAGFDFVDLGDFVTLLAMAFPIPSLSEPGPDGRPDVVPAGLEYRCSTDNRTHSGPCRISIERPQTFQAVSRFQPKSRPPVAEADPL
ncbi:MAG: hypothetical protein RH863_13115 [Parvibaculum sp.]